VATKDFFIGIVLFLALGVAVSGCGKKQTTPTDRPEKKPAPSAEATHTKTTSTPQERTTFKPATPPENNPVTAPAPGDSVERTNAGKAAPGGETAAKQPKPGSEQQAPAPEKKAPPAKQ